MTNALGNWQYVVRISGIMEISPDQLERYRRSAREREIARNQQLVVRRERAWQLANRASELLKQKFSAT
jgi:hypothetical protein